MGLEAMPKRYYDVQALFHTDSEEFSWDNGDATKTTSKAVLNLFIWLDWFLYLFFGYLTLINYSHFIAAKSWSDYSNYTLTSPS